MDDPSPRTLLAHLSVVRREAEEPQQSRERRYDAFTGPDTAQRPPARTRTEPPTPRHQPDGGRQQTQVDSRTPDVIQHHAEHRARTHAAEPGTPAAVSRGYAAFADLVDLAPAAAFIRDRHGRYLWANHAYAHLYGTVPRQLVGKYIEDFDTPAEADRFRALDQQILARGMPVRHTLRYRRPDGSTGRAFGHRFPVREYARTCIAGIYVDITDHLRATAQRQEAEESLSALRDHSGLPCALLSANGRVIEASAAAAELLQIGLPDLLGRRAQTLLAPGPASDLDLLHRRWNSLIARRTRRVETTTLLIDSRGLQCRAEVHLTTIGHSAGRARHVWAVVTRQSLAHEAHPPLTAAQIRILSLLAQGSSNSDIATSLRLSRQTLDYHLSRLRQLLGAGTRPALVARAYVLGILAPQAWPPRSATAPHPLSPA